MHQQPENLSDSSADSFHSALSIAEHPSIPPSPTLPSNTTFPPHHTPLAAPTSTPSTTHTSTPRHTPKPTSRTRWFFQRPQTPESATNDPHTHSTTHSHGFPQPLSDQPESREKRSYHSQKPLRKVQPPPKPTSKRFRHTSHTSDVVTKEGGARIRLSEAHNSPTVPSSSSFPPVHTAKTHRQLPRNFSERSSQESTSSDIRLVAQATTRRTSATATPALPPRPPLLSAQVSSTDTLNLNDSPRIRLPDPLPTPRQPLRLRNASSASPTIPPPSTPPPDTSTIQTLSTPALSTRIPTRTSITPDDSVDDWGLDELSDDSEIVPTKFPAKGTATSRSGSITRLHDRRSPPQKATSSNSVRDHGPRDAITLTAFDEELDQHAILGASDLPRVSNVIGVYADPAAETDDWADDFVLEQGHSPPGDSSESRTVDDGSISFLSWFPEKESNRADAGMFSIDGRDSDPAINGSHTVFDPTTEEIMLKGDDTLKIRNVPQSAFQTPSLTHASLLKFPGIGYQASVVHPSCSRVKELFARYDTTIKRHFDALVRDSGGTIALDERTRSLYYLSDDSDVSGLAKENEDLSSDILLWKLEWATLNGCQSERARILLRISKTYKDTGNFREALRLIHEALKALGSFQDTALALALASELEYENAILTKGLGAVVEARLALTRAMAHGAELSHRQEDPDDLIAPQQRGLWWQLRCKYVLAGILYDHEDWDTAVQYFSEYIVESITRMIGLIAPPRSEETTLGAEYMRYCLFSPRRLVLAMWTTVMSLGEMKCFAAAADIASLTSLVASSFGYEDANNAAANVRSRIKEIAADLRQQYDDISQNILQNDGDESEITESVQKVTGASTSGFTYNVGDFGDVGEEVEEDWDAELEKELNIVIERCCDVDKSNDAAMLGTGVPTDTSLNIDGSIDHAFPIVTKAVEQRKLFHGIDGGKKGIGKGTAHFSRWAIGPQPRHLIEAELRQYLGRIGGAASTYSSQQMFPKPTQPFDGQLMGPREHENFLRRYVRSKDPGLPKKLFNGVHTTSLWNPSEVCKLNSNIHLIDDTDSFPSDSTILTPDFGLRLLDMVWKVVRSQAPLETKQSHVRRLILNSFSKVSTAAKMTPAQDKVDRQKRLGMLAGLLESIRLAREIVTDTGEQAVWFSRACMFLGITAATVTPAAKAAVELFQAESRAHCGVKAVVSAVLLDRCVSSERQRGDESDMMTENTARDASHQNTVPPELRQSVVDVLHALYWRTKAGFDESSDSNSLERLLHAEVTSSLFLTGSGISPVDGSPIDLAKEVALLCIPKKRRTKSIDSNTLVDETRRVSSPELIGELQSLWLSLPSSGGLVRSKVSFALAHHSKVDQRDYARAERFLFDGLRSVHTASTTQGSPDSFFSSLLHISPIAIVSSPLGEAILRSYGQLALSHSKYRYGIAALEAATDSRRVSSLNKDEYRSEMAKVIEAAERNSDWRRSLLLLYNLRTIVHPKDGLRNEFLHLCMKMYRICFNLGCFEAAVVPLRAYSALIYEERLRVLLQKYRRRLAKKAGNRFRRHFHGSPLPTILPGASAFQGRRNTLASFFETPIATAAALENSIRQSRNLPDMRIRSDTVVPLTNVGSERGVLKRLSALLWPLPTGSKQRSEKKPLTNLEKDTSPSPRKSQPAFKANEKAQARRSSAVVSGVRIEKEDDQYKDKQRELLRIEAEQEVAADSDRFRVELLRARTDFARADYGEADRRCSGLLEMRISHASRYKVCEILARIRLKQREITRCLEFVDQMEHEFLLAEANDETPSEASEFQISQEAPRGSIFRMYESSQDSKSESKATIFIPQVTFLRLVALIHGGRLNEALSLADKALELSEQHSFWDQGRLHYLRGKALNAISSPSAPPFQREEDAIKSPNWNSTAMDMHFIQLTMDAFETASRYYDAAGDEICTAKADLMWARTCIDLLFRPVVLKSDSGGGLPLDVACNLLDKRISITEVFDAVYNVVNIAVTANIPLLLIDAMAALAEVKCIQGHASSSWGLWVSEAWKLFSRLFTDAEDFRVVLQNLAPVSVLFRLRNLCGRLVRLVMCDEQGGSMSDMNRHLRLFEAYVTLQIAIDRKMNLASSAHRHPSPFSPTPSGDINEQDQLRADEGHGSAAAGEANFTPSRRAEKRMNGGSSGGLVRLLSPRSFSNHERRNGNSKGEVISEEFSESSSEKTVPRRPAGAFLHLLGDEGVALGRQGFSVFINRPRQQVMSAVKETGAVLIPSNFFANSREAPGSGSHELGRDAEMIFPFKPNLGLGAMQILDDDTEAGTKIHSLESSQSREQMGTTDRASPQQDTQGTSSDGENEDSDSGEQVEIASNTEAQDRASISGDVVEPQVPLGETENEPSENSTVERQEQESLERKKVPVRNALKDLLEAIRRELEGGSTETDGSSSIFGRSTAERVWSNMHRIKTETKRYMHGEISLEQLHDRNGDAILAWAQCIPLSRKEWTIPESISRRLVYTLYAHGIVGYYSVDRGGSIGRVAFGGKQTLARDEHVSPISSGSIGGELRSPTDAERLYLYELVKGFKRDGVWHKNRDSEVLSGMARHVLRAPRLLLSSLSPAQKSRSRPIVLVADLPLQIIPWELFFDHVVIRSHCLLDVIRGLQDDSSRSTSSIPGNEDPAVAAARRIARFISFRASRREVVDLERTEEARRQQLAFHGILRLNHMNPPSLIAFLGMGGFSAPTALNANSRPTGPLSSPLSQSRKAVKLFGLRISANIGRRNYPHMDFLKVSGLGSASKWDLKEAAMVLQPNLNDKEEPQRDLGAYVPVFMFSYADLVDSSDSVFGLRRIVPNGILMFTPAIHMKVLARHLEDGELSVELARASGRIHNRIFADVTASARVLVEYVSRFSREKRIPIVVFLGQGLVDVFPRKRSTKSNTGGQRTPAAERLVQLSTGGRMEYLRRTEMGS